MPLGRTLLALSVAALLAPAALAAQQRPLRLYSAPPPPPPPPSHGPGHGHGHHPIVVLPVWWGPWGWGAGWEQGYQDAWQRPMRRPAARDTVPRPSAADSVRQSLLRTRGVRAADPLLPWQVDVRAARADSAGDPEYPLELTNRRIPGRVIAQFVVDAAGRPDSASLRILLSTDRAFVDAVRAWLPASRWTPARKGGEAVTAMVEETFVFR